MFTPAIDGDDPPAFNPPLLGERVGVRGMSLATNSLSSHTVIGTEFDDITVQALRHSHASQLIHAGVHIKTISERLGHSTIVITLDTYAHLLPSVDEEAASIMGELLL